MQTNCKTIRRLIGWRHKEVGLEYGSEGEGTSDGLQFFLPDKPKFSGRPF